MTNNLIQHPSKYYRPDIDGLRGVAVLAVVGFHAFAGRFPGGFIGVDIFFVISGFLISRIIFSELENGTFSILEFYRRRVRRIFPALIAVLVSCLLVGWYLLLSDEYRQFGKHTFGGALFSSNFFLWAESGYFDNAAELKPLLHLWSLAIEEQFYLFWPILLILVWKRKWNFAKITIIIGVISFLVSLYLVNKNPTAAFYSPLPRFWELMIGGILAYASIHYRWLLDSFCNTRAWLGFALLAIAFLAIDKQQPFPGFLALLPTCAAFLIISAGPQAWPNRVFLSNRAMVWVGLISYPLYLWHWPLLSFTHIQNNIMPSAATKMLCVATAFALSYLTYRFIEKPIRFYRKTQIAFASLLVSMTVVGTFGAFVFASNGVVFRKATEFDLAGGTDFHWTTYVRNDVCYLDDPDLTKFDPKCIETKRPLIALWGDSTAASLYPGLAALQNKRGFGIIQVTQAACAPEIGLVAPPPPYRAKVCRPVNESVARILQENRPDRIILHAHWVVMNKEIEQNLRHTIRVLIATTGAKIIVVGPPPDWNKSPRYTTYSQSKKDGTDAGEVFGLPALTPMKLELASDSALRQLAKQEGAVFVSLIDALCERGKCVTRVNDSPEGWIATDQMHLSKAGSEFAVTKLSEALLDK